MNGDIVVYRNKRLPKANKIHTYFLFFFTEIVPSDADFLADFGKL